METFNFLQLKILIYEKSGNPEYLHKIKINFVQLGNPNKSRSFENRKISF